ncbi:zona pellucida protein AX 1 [Betta splendens]|uniref:Zona pellucida protein AX 1 n=1 Tax=Betta splendens TaxID=158456 RepID=A0A6P7LRV9_BETSP|nr:zona pellucida protein AX 1 [Betta splendens]
MQRLQNILLWNLMAAAIVFVEAKSYVMLNLQSSSSLKSDCVGNQMRLSLDKALAIGNQLEVEAINGSRHIVLNPSLAAQCGYSMESDPWGNTRIYTSLMGCYVGSREDKTFGIGLRLQMYKLSTSEIVSRDVTHTCSYSRWASKEILCERNFMEVSNYMSTSDGEAKGHHSLDVKDPNHIPDASGPAYDIWKMTFYTPEPLSMVLREAQDAGYGARITSNRLVVRSPYMTSLTYPENVAGIPMEVLRVSTYYKSHHGLRVMNLAAACPTGGVLFSDDLISWYVPRRVTPLIDGSFKVLETHMGINGQRLEESQMEARGYTLSVKDFHIVIEIPIGSPDGYYKSHAPDYQYHVTYSVEPMLEVLWKSPKSHDDVRYKVLFPISTPLLHQPPQVKDNTVIDDRIFSVSLGTFLHDVVLKNITFSTGALTVEECNARGFTVREYNFPNRTKRFSLEVAFDADVVIKRNPELLVTHYLLPLVFGFLILPEESPFMHPVNLQASVKDIVLPSLTGTCDPKNFYVIVKYGSRGPNFQTVVGARPLTPELSGLYNVHDNGTHVHMVVPYTAEDSVFETITSNSVRARLDILLLAPNSHWVLGDLYLACSFPLITTRCFPNGTITAVAVKVESVPDLVPSALTLKDKSCKPVRSNDRFAYFSFTANSCGTIRTFSERYMLYENVIGLHSNKATHKTQFPLGYRQTVSCYYLIKKNLTVSFHNKPRSKDPVAETGSGRLLLQMRLARDSSYEHFYQEDDYPVVKYLRQPLYFEVGLIQSTDPHLELILENCWATLHEDRASLPRWDIIINTCKNGGDRYATDFHPVVSDATVTSPSHTKRFSVKMFAFTQDDEVLKHEIYVHCDAVICEPHGHADGACSGQCVHPTVTSKAKHEEIKGIKREQRNAESSHQKQISSGPILLLIP